MEDNGLLIHLSASTDPVSKDRCMTVVGESPSKECQFPFIFRKVKYNGCPPDLANPEKSWCSTKVDATRNHIRGKDNFGICSPGCPKSTGSNNVRANFLIIQKKIIVDICIVFEITLSLAYFSIRGAKFICRRGCSRLIS